MTDVVRPLLKSVEQDLNGWWWVTFLYSPIPLMPLDRQAGPWRDDARESTIQISNPSALQVLWKAVGEPVSIVMERTDGGGYVTRVETDHGTVQL